MKENQWAIFVDRPGSLYETKRTASRGKARSEPKPCLARLESICKAETQEKGQGIFR